MMNIIMTGFFAGTLGVSVLALTWTSWRDLNGHMAVGFYAVGLGTGLLLGALVTL